MKKVLGILLLVLLLAACGNSDDEVLKDDQEEKQTDQIEEISAEVEEVPVEEEITEDTEDVVEESEDAETAKTESEEPTEEVSQSMTEAELKELIEYTGIGEGDELVSVSIEGLDINAVINLAPSELFSGEDLAITRYSQLSDELLNHEDWYKLTIEYSGIGTISMDRSEVGFNEYGEYFPAEKIGNNLN